MHIPQLKFATLPEAIAGTGTIPSKSLRILLVEDHEDTRRAMDRLLKRWGHEVHSAGTITEALAMAPENEFDLLLSDLELPDGTGIDLLKKLRAQHPIRAVAMSGHGLQSDMARTREAGFDEHLVKPVHMDQLKQIIESLGSP